MSSSKPLGGLLALTVLVAVPPAVGQEDLAALRVLGQRGQSAEQTRRDRYECHNWAVEQTGEVPLAVPPDEPSDAERERRAERADRAITGAAIGAGLGGLVRATQRKNSGHGVLAGAAIGAAIGAATAGSRDEADEADEPSDYLRALTACLEGRGYSVALP